MNRKFRSRGFRISFDENQKWIVREKLYFDADDYEASFENDEIITLLQNNIIHRFEYALSENEEIDAINFHVNLKADISHLYLKADECLLKSIKDIPYIFDINFLNYTIGFKIRKNNNAGNVFYFYPTILKPYGYGIRGVVDTNKIHLYCRRLSQYFAYAKHDEEIVFQYGDLAKKFKGISIAASADNKNKISMKLYAKMSDADIDRIMRMIALKNNMPAFNFNSIQREYGDSCLSALRINNRIVDGINVYYLT